MPFIAGILNLDPILKIQVGVIVEELRQTLASREVVLAPTLEYDTRQLRDRLRRGGDSPRDFLNGSSISRSSTDLK